MPTYEYRALAATGQETKGHLEAPNERSARQNLRQDGLTPLALKETADSISRTTRNFRQARWPRAQRVLFTRQLAALLAAGMPLEAALAMLSDQTEDQVTSRLIRAIRTEIAAGQAFSTTLTQHPQAFDPMYCALVKVAEKTGRLDQVLADLAQHLETGDTFRQKTAVALVYPVAILVIAVLVISGLLIYVVPQIVEVFARQHQALPLLTRMLIALSDALRVSWLPLLAIALASAWPLTRALRQPAVRARLLNEIARLPIIGKMLRTAGTHRLAATLGMALKGGVPLIPALALATDVLTLPTQKAAITALADAVSRGASLGAALQGERGAPFEPALRHFVILGEKNGQLADMLTAVAAQQRASLEYRLGWLTGLLEPALVVIMGAVVLTIVLAILLPIIEINQFLR